MKLMEEEITKEFIDQNLFTKSGYINAPKAKKLGLNIKELYLIYHNIQEPKCPTCDGPVKFLGFSKGFAEHCSNKCTHNDPKVIEKKKQTCINKYGTEFASQAPENIKKVQNTILNAWNRKRDQILEKRYQTNLERYGTKEVFQSEEIKEKARDTIYKKYGENHVMNVPEIKEKWRNSLLDDWPNKSEKIKEKTKQTNLERYGYEYIPQVPEITEKRVKNIAATLREKYQDPSYRKAGYVYILYSPKLDLKKVGYSMDVHKRFKDIKKDINDPNLELLQYKYYENATQVEFAIHKMLKKYNVVLNEKSIGYTEWYNPIHIQLV